ncbi:hypothetical protein QBC40DRAFT_352914 [Triangularia verruculosa]|uniref:Uncharacterized protein n=1 Tax=Triangularia verruculosa TaxID=2587418 RepID=A0AAN6X8T6_9PEZI|nr:hypothetical protein QBC40DRAFT_352914 [Triangularia verruculosa]
MSSIMDIIQDDFASTLDIHQRTSSHPAANRDRLAHIMEIRRRESPAHNQPRYHDPATPPSSPPLLSSPSSLSSSSSSSSGSPGSPPDPKPSPPEFPQFSLFPGELQNLIWDHAAALFSAPTSRPGIHFLLQPTLLHLLPLNPNDHPPPFIAAPYQLSTPWLSNDLDLVPTRHSFALNLFHLLITCRASRAAILRNNLCPPFSCSRTILRSPAHKPSFLIAPGKSVDLSLDLHRDLISLTSATASCDEVRRMLDYTDGNHFIFTAARKFAVRYGSGWELPSPGPFQHDRRCPVGWMGMRGGGRPGFCSRCVGRLIERFGRLEEVWVLVDLPSEGGWKRAEGWGRGKEFEGFDKRYFAVEGVMPVGEGEGNGNVVEEGLEVLERVKSNLKDPRYYHMPWVCCIIKLKIRRTAVDT